MVRAMIEQFSKEAFDEISLLLLERVAFCGFRHEGVFDMIIPDLVLHGLREAHRLNICKEAR